jgi:GNAT superfamily N-acetyltransferase
MLARHDASVMTKTAAVQTTHAAVQVWREAWAALWGEPSADRVQRVRGKVSDPRSFLLLQGGPEAPVGMALAEPYRSANGFGTVQPGRGHISMVFVRPQWQGAGIGGELLGRMIDEAPWPSLSLWIQGMPAPVGTLRRLGFRATSEWRTSSRGVRAQRWERSGL